MSKLDNIKGGEKPQEHKRVYLYHLYSTHVVTHSQSAIRLIHSRTTLTVPVQG